MLFSLLSHPMTVYHEAYNTPLRELRHYIAMIFLSTREGNDT